MLPPLTASRPPAPAVIAGSMPREVFHELAVALLGLGVSTGKAVRRR